MSLDISTKPLGASGKNVADLAFKFPLNTKRHGEEILGIVDTKSNGEKNLSEEKMPTSTETISGRQPQTGSRTRTSPTCLLCSIWVGWMRTR